MTCIVWQERVLPFTFEVSFNLAQAERESMSRKRR